MSNNPLLEFYNSNKKNNAILLKNMHKLNLQWEPIENRSRYSFIDQYGNIASFGIITTYKKNGRLRIPAGTRKQLYMNLIIVNGDKQEIAAHITKHSKAIIGENSISGDKLKIAKENMIKYAAKIGISIEGIFL